MITIHCPRCGSIIYDDFGDALDEGMECPTCFAGDGEYEIQVDDVRARYHILMEAVDPSESVVMQEMIAKAYEELEREGRLSRKVAGRLVRDRQKRMQLEYEG